MLRRLASAVGSTMTTFCIGMILLLGTLPITTSFITTRPSFRNVIVWPSSSGHHQLPAPVVVSVTDSRPGSRSLTVRSASSSSSSYSSEFPEGTDEKKKDDTVLRCWWKNQNRRLNPDRRSNIYIRGILSNNNLRTSSTTPKKQHILRHFQLPQRASTKTFASKLLQYIVTTWTKVRRSTPSSTRQDHSDHGHFRKQWRTRRLLASLILGFSIWHSNHRLGSPTATSATVAHAAAAAATTRNSAPPSILKTPWNLVRTVSSTSTTQQQQQVTTSKGERVTSSRESTRTSPSPLSRPSVVLVSGSIAIYAVHQKQKQYVQQQQQLLDNETKRREFQSDLKRNIMTRSKDEDDNVSSPSSKSNRRSGTLDPKSAQERVQEMLERVKKAQGTQPALRRTKSVDSDGAILAKTSETATEELLSPSSVEEVPGPLPPGVAVAVAVAASSSLVDETPQTVVPSTTSEIDTALSLVTEAVPVVPLPPPPGVGVAVAVPTASSLDDTQTVVQSLKSVSGKSVESELDVVTTPVDDEDDATTTAAFDLATIDDDDDAIRPSNEADGLTPTDMTVVEDTVDDLTGVAVATSMPSVTDTPPITAATDEESDTVKEPFVSASMDIQVPPSTTLETEDIQEELVPVDPWHPSNVEVVPPIGSATENIASEVLPLEDHPTTADEEPSLDVIYLTDKDLATEPTIETTTLSQATAEDALDAAAAAAASAVYAQPTSTSVERDAPALFEETSPSTLHYATQNAYLEKLEESTIQAQSAADQVPLPEELGATFEDNAELAIAFQADAALEAPVAQEVTVFPSAPNKDVIVAEEHAVVSTTTDAMSVDAAPMETSQSPIDDSTNVHDAPSIDSFPAWIREKVRSKRQLQQQGRILTTAPPISTSSTSPSDAQVSPTTSVATAVSSVTDSVTALASRASTIVAPIRSTSRLLLEAPMIIPKLVTTDKYVRARHQPKNPAEEDALSQKYAAIPTLEERAYTILKDLGMLEGSDDIENIH